MAEKQKPKSDIVHKAAQFLTHPEKATPADIKSMAARILDDQRNDPETHKSVKTAAAKAAAPKKATAKKAAPRKAAPMKAAAKKAASNGAARV